MDDRVWLHHAEHGGYFHCPEGAVADWASLGWRPSEPPPEPTSPVVAERLAWEAEQKRAAGAAAKPTTTTSARRGDTEE